MSALCYKKLWKLLIERNIPKGELCSMADISRKTIAKLSKNGNVTTETIAKICSALDCTLNEIADVAVTKGHD